MCVAAINSIVEELSGLELGEDVREDMRKLEALFCEEAQTDKESDDKMSAIASCVIFMDATGYPFISSDNNSNGVSEVQRLIETRREQMCKRFKTELETAHLIFDINFCKKMRVLKTCLKKSLPDDFKRSWDKIVKAFPGLKVHDVFSAFGHVPSALSESNDKNETWWRVHVWGHLMDNFLMNAPGLNFNREKQSGSFACGSASSKISDAILITSNDSEAMGQQVCILHEEEKPPLKPGGNKELWNCSSRDVPLHQYKSNQGDLIKLFRSMRATLVKRKAGHDERLRCYGIQWVGSRVGIYSMCAGVGAYFVCSQLFHSVLQSKTKSIREILCAMLALRCLLVEEAELEMTCTRNRSSIEIYENPSTPQKPTLVCPLSFSLYSAA